ncbi:hypothetical protein HYT05_04525 [Candidatus Kaiserbacteria bacterium]|nr:hypothetical protein [Candidatus Kaiserbacteria bacterium]
MTFIKQHRAALVMAVLVGLCAVAPSLLAWTSAGTHYQGIQYLPIDDEDIYRARIHEILDGHAAVSSPFLYEYKAASAAVTPVNEWLYALPALLFGLSAVIVASKFILPALLFLLVYSFVSQLLGSGARGTALAAGLLVVLGSDFVDYQYLLSLLHGLPPRPLLWTRLVNPIIGGIELFGFLALLLVVHDDPKRRLVLVSAAALLSAAVGYFFSFALALAVLGVLFVFALVRREFDEAKGLFVVGALSVVFDAVWWYHSLTAFGGSSGVVAALRNGMFFTHAPVLNKALLAATLIVVACFAYAHSRRLWRGYERAWIFIAALLGGSWIAFNQQVITGREIWYQHFVQYTVPLCMIAVLAAAHMSVGRTFPRVYRGALALLAVVCLSYGAYSVMNYMSRMPGFAHSQEYAPLFAWLDEHASEGCVVLDAQFNEEMQRLIPAYTGCDVYETTVTFSGVPHERIVHNYLVRLGLNGVASADAERYINAHEEDVRTYFYSDWNQMFGHGAEPWIAERAAQLAGGYQAFAAASLAEGIRKYRMDYLVAQEPLAPHLFEKLPSIHAVGKAGQFTIYAL